MAMLSFVVGVELVSSRGSVEGRVLGFARAEAPLPEGVPREPCRSSLELWSDGGCGRRRLVGTLLTTRRSAEPSLGRTGDLFLLDGLRLLPELGGYTPSAHRLLISLAVSRLAWTEADNEGAAALVAIRIGADDRRVREDLRMFRARPLSNESVLSHGLAAMSADVPTGRNVEYWSVTPEMVRMCARHVLGLDGAQPAWRIGRESGCRQQLHVRIGLGWLVRSAPHLAALADGSIEVRWGPLPLVEGDDEVCRVAERERRDHEEPDA